ncbi:MAG: hypothetical protein NTW87_25745, partial [Planctomycetota bacterium]|nr:hypothetical protein [Planctomycetota bacterium]
MSTFFSEPYLLLLAPCACAWLCLLWRRFRSEVPAFRRRKAVTLGLYGAAALALVLGASGFQVPAHAPRQMLVVAADVSDSIFDLATQSTRLNEKLG